MDACLFSATPGVKEEKEWGYEATKALSATTSWGSELDLVEAPLEEDILDLDCGEDDHIVSNFIISEGSLSRSSQNYWKN